MQYIKLKIYYSKDFFTEGYAYIGQDEHWHLKEDAPDWAKKEFEQYLKQINAEPNEQGIVTQH